MSDLTPNEQARILYVSLLGIAIAAYLLYEYRGRLGTAFQHAAIWGLIFVGAILAFGFKDQLAVLLWPGQGQVDGTGAVVIARSADGHFHALMEVNGVPVDFLVDTGASEMVLSEQDARRVGLDPAELAYTRTAQTANGLVRGAPVRLAQVRFAGQVDREVPAVVNGGRMRTSLLGMRYLDRFQKMEITGDRLRLLR